MPSSQTYVAMLRGINVGGNKLIKMAELKRAFEALKFKNVKTILASGNVLFDAPKADPKTVAQKIEAKLAQEFKSTISTLVRSLDEIQALIDSEPFKKITVTANTRLYVTFLTDKPQHKIKIPYATPDKAFRILRVSNTEVCSVLEINPNIRSTDVMNILEKEFGKKVTTRNWNTVLKFAKQGSKA